MLNYIFSRTPLKNLGIIIILKINLEIAYSFLLEVFSELSSNNKLNGEVDNYGRYIF